MREGGQELREKCVVTGVERGCFHVISIPVTLYVHV